MEFEKITITWFKNANLCFMKTRLQITTQNYDNDIYIIIYTIYICGYSTPIGQVTQLTNYQYGFNHIPAIHNVSKPWTMPAVVGSFYQCRCIRPENRSLTSAGIEFFGPFGCINDKLMIWLYCTVFKLTFILFHKKPFARIFLFHMFRFCGLSVVWNPILISIGEVLVWSWLVFLDPWFAFFMWVKFSILWLV